jgi:hypothetical protein
MTSTAFEGFTDEELGHLITMLGKSHSSYSMTAVFGGALVEEFRRRQRTPNTAPIKCELGQRFLDWHLERATHTLPDRTPHFSGNRLRYCPFCGDQLLPNGTHGT